MNFEARKVYCGISRIGEGEFSRISDISDIRDVINSRIAVEMIDKWARWLSAQGVKAGEV